MGEINYKLQVFEGPLDLLLHLIDINKIDIYDIPVSEITDQYLEYIHDMQLDDMDTASDFLVMAAQLLCIKSRILLPAEPAADGEEETDPRSELVQRLLEYRMYRYLSQKLKNMGSAASRCCFKDTTIPEDIEYTPEPVDTAELFRDIGLADLQRIFQDVMKRNYDKVDRIRSGYGRIEEEPVDFAEKSREIRQIIREKRSSISFRSLLEDGNSREEVIVTFLVILELMKDGTVHTSQNTLFDDILIEVTA